MPPVHGVPGETPCVLCGALPTVAYSWAGIQRLSGRVCAEHASQLADDGYCVAGDGGHVENWGRVVG